MSSGGFSMFAYLDKNAFVISTSVFCVVTTLANLFLMISILASPSLRTSSKHILIFTLCLTDLYYGVFVFPLTAEFYSLERWTHDPNILKALDMSLYLLMISLRVSLVISICVDTILNMLTRNKRLLILLSVSLIIASLLYSLVLVLPVSEGPPNPDRLDNCYWSVRETKQTALSVISFFPQALVMIVLVVDIFIMSCCLSTSFHGYGVEHRSVPIDVVLACVLMLIYITPFRIVHGYFSSCSGAQECERMHIVRGVTGQWERVRPCLMPFVWLLSRETWRGIRQACCCGRSEAPSNLTASNNEIGSYKMPNQMEKAPQQTKL